MTIMLVLRGPIFVALCAMPLMAGATVLGKGKSSPEALPIPHGCGNPYADVPDFMSFFESTLNYMAAKRGPQAKGVVDLFSVSELRSEMRQLFPSVGEESPIDRLIINQICNFQKISVLNPSTAENSKSIRGSVAKRIDSSDEKLHDHLVAISSQLYRDCKKLLLAALTEREKDKQLEGLVASKWSDIRKARELGRKQVRDLFDE